MNEFKILFFVYNSHKMIDDVSKNY